MAYDFTDGEMKVAMILVNECLAGMGGERPSDLEHDEYTWADPEDLRPYGFSKYQAAGYWSSLSDKGFIFEYDKGQWFVATEGWRYIDTVWDANQHMLKR